MSGRTDRPARGGQTVAIVVMGAVIVLLIGVVVSLWSGRGRPPNPETSATTPGPPAVTSPGATTVTPPPPVSMVSVCGLAGDDPAGSTWTDYMMVLDKSQWVLWGTTMVPGIPTVGPGATADAGYPYCFAHTVQGAINAAAWYARLPPGLPSREAVGAWLEYAVAPGPYHDRLVTEGLALTAGTGSWGASRVDLAGFRVVGYDETTAKIEIAMTGTGAGGTTWGSSTIALVWQDGDWKFDASTARAMVSASIPSLDGFSNWYVSG